MRRGSVSGRCSNCPHSQSHRADLSGSPKACGHAADEALSGSLRTSRASGGLRGLDCPVIVLGGHLHSCGSRPAQIYLLQPLRRIATCQLPLGNEEPQQPVRLRPNWGCVVLPARHRLPGDTHVLREVGAGPSEALSQKANLVTRKAGGLVDEDLRNQSVELLNVRDRDLVVVAAWAAGHVHADQRHVLEARLVVPVVLLPDFHCGSALSALHVALHSLPGTQRPLLHAVTITNSRSERNAITTVILLVSRRYLQVPCSCSPGRTMPPRRTFSQSTVVSPSSSISSLACFEYVNRPFLRMSRISR